MTHPPHLTLRAGTPEDGQAIRDLHEASIRALGGSAYTPEEVESWIGVLEPHRYGEAMTKGRENFLLAVDGDGGLAGFCSYRADEVIGLYVAPAWARRGVGTMLLSVVEQAIAAAGHARIRIDAALSGRAFYEAHGYRVMAERISKTRGGLEIASVLMEKQQADIS